MTANLHYVDCKEFEELCIAINEQCHITSGAQRGGMYAYIRIETHMHLNHECIYATVSTLASAQSTVCVLTIVCGCIVCRAQGYPCKAVLLLALLLKADSTCQGIVVLWINTQGMTRMNNTSSLQENM